MYPGVRHVVGYFGRKREYVEDAVQDAVFRVQRALGQFSYHRGKGSAYNWLCQIARNEERRTHDRREKIEGRELSYDVGGDGDELTPLPDRTEARAVDPREALDMEKLRRRLPPELLPVVESITAGDGLRKGKLWLFGLARDLGVTRAVAEGLLGRLRDALGGGLLPGFG